MESQQKLGTNNPVPHPTTPSPLSFLPKRQVVCTQRSKVYSFFFFFFFFFWWKKFRKWTYIQSQGMPPSSLRTYTHLQKICSFIPHADPCGMSVHLKNLIDKKSGSTLFLFNQSWSMGLRENMVTIWKWTLTMSLDIIWGDIM